MGTSNSKMWLALLALGFVWGSSFILMKMALFDTAGERLFPALDVALGRIAIDLPLALFLHYSHPLSALRHRTLELPQYTGDRNTRV